MTAFYFREFGKQTSGDRTFEFTHKSFGEYLTARRIIRAVDDIQDEIERHQKNPDKGYSTRGALEVWARICGPTEMDNYLFNFVRDEVASYDPEEIEKWQNSFGDMLSSAVRHAMPMEKLGIDHFAEMLKQSRNAEESLLAIHYACFISHPTKKSVIDWGDSTAFGVWWKRIQGQRKGSGNPLAANLLSGLNLSACHLDMTDFFSGYLMGINLQDSHLYNANLESADLRKANLEGADLRKANLEGANLEGANLQGAILERAILQGANLQGAILERAILQGANLQGANLEGANLEGAILEEARLQGVNLKKTNLDKSYIQNIIRK